MKLFLYYATRTIKNQIKKLCKTWVAIFLIVCLAFGLLVGFGAALLENLAEEQIPEVEIEETLPEEEVDIPIELSPQAGRALVELMVGGVVLLFLAFQILSANKSGSHIFTMADVNLLFAAPMKPQSVLLFRLAVQLGSLFAVGCYLAFQIPNLVLNAGLSLPFVLALFFGFVLLLVWSQLIKIFFFTAASTNQTVRRLIAPIGYGLLIVTAGAFVLYYRASELSLLDAAFAFFNAPVTRWIPVWGWLKALIMAAFEGSLLLFLLMALLLIVGAAVLAYVIWHMRADFYEDALQHSTEVAEIMEAAQNSDTPTVIRRKKDRSDKLRRDALSHGFGASVILFKNLYNRFRFAYLGGIFTKTAITYLVIGGGLAIFLRTVTEVRSMTAVALVLAGLSFFRSLGNPIATEITKTPFLMMPESAHKKVCFAILGGTLDCLLDLLPAFVVATVALGVNPLISLAWIVLILSVDLYSSAVGLFLDLSLSVSLAKNIRSVIQIMFVYFGLLPIAVIVAIGAILNMLPLFCVFSTLFNLVIGALFLMLAPLFLIRGRR